MPDECPAIDHRYFWMLREKFQLLLDLGGLPYIVGVEESNEAAPAHGPAQFACGTSTMIAAVGMGDEPDAAITCCMTASDLPAPISGAVIRDDQFPVRRALLDDAHYRLIQICLAVVDDDYAGHDWGTHSHSCREAAVRRRRRVKYLIPR